MGKDPTPPSPADLYNKFISDNNFVISLVIAFNGERSQAAAALFNKIMAENGLTWGIGVTGKELPAGVRELSKEEIAKAQEAVAEVEKK